MAKTPLSLIISQVLAVITFIIAVIFAFWYIFGDSPTLEQALLIFIVGATVTTLIEIRVLANDHKHLKRSFHALAVDFKEHVKHK